MPFFTAASTALWSCIEGPLVEKITDAARKTRLKHQVQDFTERRYRDRFETISLTEEFDFEGINIFCRSI
ncbi:MAG: hypothetical protein LUG57_10740 [Oscillospiraceae bacterium]|nr:hypothetical protein [Oscillospiraceae bacterium]